MQSQLKVLQSEQTKGKSAGKVGTATEELQYLMNFNASITQCMAKAMEHLSDFAFVSMAIVILVRQNSYLACVKSELKQDTFAALCQAPLDLPALFTDSVLRKAEEDICKFEDKGWSHTQSAGRRDSWFHHYRRLDKQSQDQKSGKPAWKTLGRFSKKKGGRQSNKFSSCTVKGQLSYKIQ